MDMGQPSMARTKRNTWRAISSSAPFGSCGFTGASQLVSHSAARILTLMPASVRAGGKGEQLAAPQLTFVVSSRSVRYRSLMHEDDLITTAVLAKVQSLPAVQRNALLLICVLNRSYDEAASELGISREELEQSLLIGRLEIARLKDEPTSE